MKTRVTWFFSVCSYTVRHTLCGKRLHFFPDIELDIELVIELDIELHIELDIELDIELHIELDIELDIELHIELDIELDIELHIELDISESRAKLCRKDKLAPNSRMKKI